MKQKAGSLKKQIREDRSLANLTKMRREKTQISKIRNVKGKITTNTMAMQKIISDYFESIYSNKFENLKEMDRFLESYNYTKLNQEDIHHLNRSITQKVIEASIKSLPKKKVQDLMDSLLNSIRPLKKS
jgi:glutamyl-tRNA reductase